MNARGGTPRSSKGRSGVCFGGFRPPKHVEEPWALARGAPQGGDCCFQNNSGRTQDHVKVSGAGTNYALSIPCGPSLPSKNLR